MIEYAYVSCRFGKGNIFLCPEVASLMTSTVALLHFIKLDLKPNVNLLCSWLQVLNVDSNHCSKVYINFYSNTLTHLNI